MTGLRETKKRHTRATIAQTAADLFRARGFAAVTVDDVAAAANVSRQTVFNYFPTKEQMLFDRQEEVLAALLALVRDQRDGASLLAAFRRHTREFWERFAVTVSGGGETHGFWEIVRASPALQDYGEASLGRQAQRVGEEIARTWSRPPDDPLCQGLARALCGVNVAVLTSGLERLTSGEDHATVVSDMLVRADEAYDVLEHGLAAYAPLRA
jgi:AcrR family transcriptional regulator